MKKQLGAASWIFKAQALALGAGLLGCSVEAAQPEAQEAASTAEQTAALIPASARGFARVSGSGSLTTSYNSTGGTVTATRNSTGKYTVKFFEFGQVGNLQVTSTLSASRRCLIDSSALDGNGTANVVVRCTTAAGTASDTQFSLQNVREVVPNTPNGKNGAYLTTTSTTGNGAGSVSLTASYNSANNTNSVFQTATGDYLVTFPGITESKSSLHVTAVGMTGAQYCKVDSTATTLSNTQVRVKCYGTGGLTTNSKFSVSFRGVGVFPYNGWANIAVSPSLAVSQNVNPQCWGPSTITVGGTTAAPLVRMPNVGNEMDGIGLVTANGISNRYCNLAANWYNSNPFEITLEPRCYEFDGTPSIAEFRITFSSKTPVPC